MVVGAELRQILLQAKTIAIVGLSPTATRPSYDVASYLQSQGYQVIPVNPNEAGKQILGQHCYTSLKEAADHIHGRIDIVDCFRQSDAMPAIVDDAISVGAGCIWMQLGVEHAAAAHTAADAGVKVVMNRCIKIDHASLIGTNT